MSERQNHGFIFEQQIIKQYNLTSSNSYTAEFDAYTLTGVGVSIKCMKYKTDIELSDIFRNASKNQDFFLIVGFWSGQKTNIIETHCLFIPYREWNSFFDQQLLKDMKEFLHIVSNDCSDDLLWKSTISQFKKDWACKTNNLIRPRFKRDHKKQKRIQCAINNKIFYSHFLPLYEKNISK